MKWIFSIRIVKTFQINHLDETDFGFLKIHVCIWKSELEGESTPTLVHPSGGCSGQGSTRPEPGASSKSLM